MKPINPPPVCCYQDARWVFLAPNLRYYFCDKCKKEVEAWTLHLLGRWDCGPLEERGKSNAKQMPMTHYWTSISDYRKGNPCHCGGQGGLKKPW